MKKLIYLIAIGIAITACQKEQLQSASNSSQPDLNKTQKPANSEIQLIESQIQNKNDYQMDLCLYDATKALMQLANDPQAMNVIMQGNAGSNETTISFSDLVKKYPIAEAVIDDYLSNFAVGSYKSLKGLTKKMTYEKVDYFPLIRVPNFSKADRTLGATFAAGIEITDHDEIMSWYSSDSYKTVSPLSEELAMKSQNPVILVINGTDYVVNADAETSNVKTQTQGVMDKHAGDRDMSVNRIRVKNGYRYEGGSSKSEVLLNFTQFSNNPFIGTVEIFSPSYVKSLHINDYVKLDELEPTEVNSSTWIDPPGSSFIHNSYWVFFDRVWITAYEYDWYASEKTVTRSSIARSHFIRMKYSNEWYFLFPDRRFADYTVGGAGTSVLWDNYKSSFEIYRPF